MDVRVIINENDHIAAIREIEELLGSKRDARQEAKLSALITLVNKYEDEAYPIPDGDPIDVIRYAISDMGRSQKEFTDVIGSSSRASEVLNRKRALTIEMIDRIGTAWALPVELLAKPYKLALREPKVRSSKAPPKSKSGRPKIAKRAF